MRFVRSLALTLPLLSIWGCQDLPTAVQPAEAPQHAILDGSRGGNPSFHWLPPTVASASYSGTFDGSHTPTVQIYQCAGRDCAAPTLIATSGAELPAVSVTAARGRSDAYYGTQWRTRQFSLNTSNTYRVRVLLGTSAVGYADVWLVDRKNQLGSVDGSQFVALLNGQSLDISFRLEQGVLAAIIASVSVSPNNQTLDSGATHQLTARLSNQDGGAITGRTVVWSSSDPSIATVNQSGAVVGVSVGTATITAEAEGIRGTATISVVAPFTFSYIAAGNGYSCGLDTGGKAFCWGRNYNYRLGTNAVDQFADQTTPIAVEGGLSFASMAASDMHTCGVARDGKAYCWGTGGRLGNGTWTGSHTPQPVAGGHTFSSVSVNWEGACGTTVGGAAYCWGDGRWGRLGDGTSQNSVALSPVRVSSGSRFAKVTVGQLHACAIADDGSAYCWGRNDNGQLGTTTTEMCDGSPCSTTPVAVSGSHRFKLLSAGANHTCAVTTSNEAYCWGYNGNDQLGTSGLLRTSTPVRVSGTLSFASVSGGMNHTCGVTTEGTGYCWGGNWEGYFGNGTHSNRTPTPVPVSGGLQFASMTTTYQHTCGVTSDGKAYCWGANGQGELGNGGQSTEICGLNNTPCVTAPVRVLNPS